MTRELRRLPGEIIVVDKRKTFIYELPDGRMAETKADTEEQARTYIEQCLGLDYELEEAA